MSHEHNEAPRTREARGVCLQPATFTAWSGAASTEHVDIGIVGDVVLTEALIERHAFELRDALWGSLASCDLILANLEGSITARTVPSENRRYNLRISPRATELFDKRFVLNLANNHVMDYGAPGLFETTSALDAAGLRYAGAGAGLDDARAPCRVCVRGIDVAVIGAADPRFQAASQGRPGTSPANVELLTEAVREARKQAHLVAVSVHMGLEHVRMPSERQIQIAEECLAAGAHLIHFHHSHCVSGAATNGRGVALFGTGNYVFPPATRIEPATTRQSAVWRVRYSRRTNSIVAVNAEPLEMDRSGLPRSMSGRARLRQIAMLRRYSQRALSPHARRLWRCLEMLRPGFVLINLYNYFGMLRRRGPLFVWKSMVAGVRAQKAK